jgi:hypothetical protein
VQRFQEDFGWGLEVQAFARCVVVEPREVPDLGWPESREVCFPGQSTSHASNGILDAAFLPGGMGVAEEGLEAEATVEPVMLGELGAVVEGDGLSQLAGQVGEQAFNGGCDGCSSFIGLAQDRECAGRSLVKSEDRLTVGAEEHEVGFPMAGLGAIGDAGWPQRNRNAVFNVIGRTSAFTTAEAAFAFAARQIEAPGIVLGAGDLRGDEAVDGLMADDDAAMLAREAPRDLLGRPAAA